MLEALALCRPAMSVNSLVAAASKVVSRTSLYILWTPVLELYFSRKPYVVAWVGFLSRRRVTERTCPFAFFTFIRNEKCFQKMDLARTWFGANIFNFQILGLGSVSVGYARPPC